MFDTENSDSNHHHRHVRKPNIIMEKSNTGLKRMNTRLSKNQQRQRNAAEVDAWILQQVADHGGWCWRHEWIDVAEHDPRLPGHNQRDERPEERIGAR